MSRFMSTALTLVLVLHACVGAAWATLPISQQAGANSCLECHRSASGDGDVPPNLDPAKKSRWEKYAQTAGGTAGPALTAPTGTSSDVTDALVLDPRDEVMNSRTGADLDLPVEPRPRSANPAAPGDSPSFDSLEVDPSGDLPVEPGSTMGPAASGTSGAGEDKLMEDELIRIDLELKELEADIRTYRALLETARDDAEAQSIKETLYMYEGQRKALRNQQSELASTRQSQSDTRRRSATATGDGPGAPADTGSTDAEIAARTLERAQGNRLKGRMEPGTNPLSPETQIGNITRDTITAVDVAKDMEVQKFIEQLKDPELQERMNALWSAVRVDASLQKSFEDVLRAIEKAGGKTAKLADVRQALEKAEAEAKRRQLGSDEFEKHFMDKAGRDRIGMVEYKGSVKVLEEFGQKYPDANKLSPVFAKALETAKTDYVAYQVALKGFIQDQSRRDKFELAEAAFQKHLKSLKQFLKTLQDVTKDGREPNGILAPTAGGPAAPELPVSAIAEPVDLTADAVAVVAATVTPTAGDVTPTAQPSAASTANPALLAKIAADLKALSDEVDAKLSDVEHDMSTAWGKDRPGTISSWFGSVDPRIEYLTTLSKHYFVWASGASGNAAFVWPQKLQRIYVAATDGGIDIEKEKSLEAALKKAKDGCTGALLLSKLMQSYDGHMKTVENAQLTEAMQSLYINRVARPPKFFLFDVRRVIGEDSKRFRTNMGELWTTKELGEFQALMAESIKKLRAETPASKMEDMKIAFARYLQKLKAGYVTSYGGTGAGAYPAYGMYGAYAIPMTCIDSPVYRVVEMVDYFLGKQMWFEAKLALDEMK